eukprot:gnl/TRDRNA2_/TRDRNA2_87415_c0_seq2.p1 gnl/TRDRNA2_/TRDRNA2_87415_c0~~gnl/TRDRNA2_/TRDRNA2_87415_c0_seq2.p1  ORF type:complete len:191 (-),score=28.31 gnl/TRDRNA2_/TRDRNA2_87415_c0_seq2:264-752(-)
MGGNALNLTTAQPLTLMLGSHFLSAERRFLEPGARAWLTFSWSYMNVPAQLLGAVFFPEAGEPEMCWDRTGRKMHSGNLTLTSTANGTVYIWSDLGNTHEHPDKLRGDGGLAKLGWSKAGVMKVGPYTMQIYSSQVASNAAVIMPIEAPWVGGVAFKEQGHM